MKRWISYAWVAALVYAAGCLQEVPPPEEDMRADLSEAEDMGEPEDTGKHRAGADAEQGSNDMSHMVGRKKVELRR